MYFHLIDLLIYLFPVFVISSFICCSHLRGVAVSGISWHIKIKFVGALLWKFLVQLATSCGIFVHPSVCYRLLLDECRCLWFWSL